MHEPEVNAKKKKPRIQNIPASATSAAEIGRETSRSSGSSKNLVDAAHFSRSLDVRESTVPSAEQPPAAKPANASKVRSESGQETEKARVRPQARPLPAASDLPIAAQKQRPIFKKMYDLLEPDAAKLMESRTRTRSNIEKPKAPRKSKAQLSVDAQEKKEPGPNKRQPPEQPKNSANPSIEPFTSNKDPDVPNLEDWMSVQEAFGSFYTKLRFNGLSGLNDSDRVLHYILRQNIKIRVLDVLFCETPNITEKSELMKR